jgi:carbon starvation protein CstA
MDGVMPASRDGHFGYHFKAIAAAGPIVALITAANLLEWSPSLVWLVLGVAFIGWVSDYSAVTVAVRNGGITALSAIAHKLSAPRTRTVLFVFIFFYLTLLAGAFALLAVKDMDFAIDTAKGWLPLWPMLFVTIACGAIAGWHALAGSTGTPRQIEYDTGAQPVGAGAMLFGDLPLALLALTAVSIVGADDGRFAAGVHKLVYAGTFGLIPETFGAALGFATFLIIVLAVTQLVFRVILRVTLSERAGDAIPIMRNMHVASLISMGVTAALLLTATWVYLWQMFGISHLC